MAPVIVLNPDAVENGFSVLRILLNVEFIDVVADAGVAGNELLYEPMDDWTLLVDVPFNNASDDALI